MKNCLNCEFSVLSVICPDTNWLARCPLSHLLTQMPALPEGEPRSRCELNTCRVSLSLAQTRPRAAPSVTACAVPPSSRRKALVFRPKQKQSIFRYSVSWWEVVDSLFCGKATPVATCIQHVAKSRLSNPLLLFSTLRVKQKRVQVCTLFFGGRWWIRTTEVVDNRFTVCPLWPLGKPPIFACRNRGAGGRT